MKKHLFITMFLFAIQLIIYIYTVVTTEYFMESSIIVAVSIMMISFILFDFIKIRKNSVERFDKYYYPLIYIPMVFLLIIQIFFIFAVNKMFESGDFIYIGIGIFFILLGNYFPRTPFKSMMGMKISWTQKSETIWRKTHRFNGMLFIIIGLGTIILSFMITSSVIMTILIVTASISATIFTAIYSYINNKKENTRGARS